MSAWFTAIRDVWLNGVKLASSDAIEFLTGFSVARDPVTGRIQITNTGGGGGGGDVTGPGSSVVDRLVLMAGTTGKVIKQSSLLVGSLLLRDGSLSLTGNLDFGTKKATNLGNGSAASQDAATVAQMEAAIAAAAGGGGGGGDGFSFTFSTNTTDADPGAGTLRINNATPGVGMTQIFIDEADTSLSDIMAWLDRLDDSIGSVKGYIRVGSKTDKTKWLLFSLQSVTVAAGYRKLGVTYVAGPAIPLTTAGDCFLSFDSTGSGDILPVVACATGNVALTGAYTVDGATVTNGQRYLAAFQSAPAQNGIYIYNSAGAHARATDMDAAAEFRPGVFFAISGGTLHGGKLAAVVTAPTTLGTDAAVFALTGFPTDTAAPAKGQSYFWDGAKFALSGVATRATNLPNSNATLAVSDGNRAVLGAGTLSASRDGAFSLSGASDKEIYTVERYDVSAFTYVIKNSAGTVIYTFPASTKRMASFQYTGEWELVSHVAIV